MIKGKIQPPLVPCQTTGRHEHADKIGQEQQIGIADLEDNRVAVLLTNIYPVVRQGLQNGHRPEVSQAQEACSTPGLNVLVA